MLLVQGQRRASDRFPPRADPEEDPFCAWLPEASGGQPEKSRWRILQRLRARPLPMYSPSTQSSGTIDRQLGHWGPLPFENNDGTTNAPRARGPLRKFTRAASPRAPRTPTGVPVRLERIHHGTAASRRWIRAFVRDAWASPSRAYRSRLPPFYGLKKFIRHPRVLGVRIVRFEPCLCLISPATLFMDSENSSFSDLLWRQPSGD